MSEPEPGAEPEIADPVQVRRATNLVAVCFGVTALAGVGLAVLYAFGGQPQWEGVLLALALGGIGIGFVLVSKHLLPAGPFVEERSVLPATDEEVEEFTADFERGEGWMHRRGFLVKMLGLAAGSLGVAAIFPIRSLGPKPGRSLFRTSWRPGSRVVDDAGRPVTVDSLSLGGFVTVFPEGAVGVADSQVALIRVDPALLHPPKSRAAWSPHGYVAYSKVCTHAGCPVGLYQRDVHLLLCPCHQSTFEVLHEAEPVFGPAARPLPQLPLMVDRFGYLRSRSDFREPIGPGFWNRIADS